MNNLRLGWMLARRELRGGVRGLRIVLACLALGVAAIAAVGTLRAGVEAGLQADGARILGGDLEIRAGSQEVEPAVLDWVRGRGGVVSQVVLLRSMLVAPSGERSLVELKAVDGRYPMFGRWGWSRPWRCPGWWRSRRWRSAWACAWATRCGWARPP
jgi:putative ABC transport system permease protein